MFGSLTAVFVLALVSFLAPRAAAAVAVTAVRASDGNYDGAINVEYDVIQNGGVAFPNYFHLYANWVGSPLTCSSDYYAQMQDSFGSNGTHNFVFTPTVAGTPINFKVGIGTDLNTDWCTPADVGWAPPPLAPSSLTASDGTYGSGVWLSWLASQSVIGGGTLRYTLQSRELPSGTWSNLATDDFANYVGIPFSHSAAVPGQVYEYRVKAASGDSYEFSSAWSGTDAGYRKPLPPTNVVATDGSLTDKVRITWSAPSGSTRLTGYKIVRTDTANNSTQEFVVPSGTSYDDSTAAAGTIYNYGVSTYFDTGTTPARAISDPVSDTGYRGTPPLAPSVLNSATVGCTNGQPTSVTLNWTGKPAADGFFTLWIRNLTTDGPTGLFWNRQKSAPTDVVASYQDIADNGALPQAGSVGVVSLNLANGSNYQAGVYTGPSSNVLSFTPSCALPTTPAISLTTSPSSLLLVKGGTVSTTITVTGVNISSNRAVSFSATGAGVSGLPSGVTSSFNPANPAYCTLTTASPTCTVSLRLDASATAPAGFSNFSVKGILLSGSSSGSSVTNIAAQILLPLQIDTQIISEECGSLEPTGWSGPTATAPNGNKPAPLHVGANAQVKAGCLGLGVGGVPQARLDVSGNVKVSGDITYGGGLVGPTSDLRLKENLETLSGALQKLLTLKAFSYTLKNDAANREHVGLIAQEVEKVFPQSVGTDPQGYKFIDYGSLVAPVIEAIKTQQTQLEALAKQVADLRATIAR